jgi:hypothetical protein
VGGDANQVLAAMHDELADGDLLRFGKSIPEDGVRAAHCAPAAHKGVITPPPVGDEGIYTKVPNPEAGHEKEVIPPPGSPGGDPNVELR